MQKNSSAVQDELVDINSVVINKELPKDERIADYIRQIKDPYNFKFGKYTVKISFSENGQTLEDHIRSLIK